MSVLVTKSINVQGVHFPINYTVLPVAKICSIQEGVDPNTCFNIINPTGTLNQAGTVEIQIQLFADTCLDCWDFQFTATDPFGCYAQTTFSFDEGGPCLDFSVSAIQRNNFLSFYILATGGSVPYDYQWSWNASNLEPIDDTDETSNLRLQLKPGESFIPGQTIEVSVTVTDNIGCAITQSTSFPLCEPTAQDISVFSYCRNDGTYFTQNITLPVIACDDCEIDLEDANNILIYDLDPSLYEIQSNGEVVVDGLQESDFSNGLFSFDYAVIDECGRISTNGTITIQQGVCNNVDDDCDLNIPLHICEQVDCSDPEACVIIDIDDYVISPNENCENEIDWSTLAIEEGPTAPATATLDAPNHAIEYCPNGTTENVDSFIFTIEDTDGNSLSVLVTIAIAVCPEPPVLVNDSYEVCQDSSDNEFDVLANDPAGILPATLAIVSGPSHGTANVSAGKIYYTPTPGYVGSDSITYEAAGANGVYGQATVTITVTAVGDAGGDAQINFG